MLASANSSHFTKAEKETQKNKVVNALNKDTKKKTKSCQCWHRPAAHTFPTLVVNTASLAQLLYHIGNSGSIQPMLITLDAVRKYAFAPQNDRENNLYLTYSTYVYI